MSIWKSRVLRDEAGEEKQNGGESGDAGSNEDNSGDNKDVKSQKWVQDLKSEVSELRRYKLEQESAAEKAKRDSEAKKFEDEKNYEAAAQKRAENAVKEAEEKLKEQHAKELKQVEAKAELARLGFQNKRFINGALLDFDPDAQSVEKFAQSVFDDPESANFLPGGEDTGDGVEKKIGTTPRGNNSVTSFTPAKLEEWSKSSDKDRREIARKYKQDYWDKHGEMPPSR